MQQLNKRVLIATGIYPPDIGGPATIVKPLAESLREQGFVVDVITYADQADVHDGVYRIIKSKMFSRPKYFYTMLRLAKKAHLIYVTDVYSVGFFAYILKKIFGRKYVVRFAGDAAWETATASGLTSDYIMDFQENKYVWKVENLKRRRRRILINADKVIVVSKFMGQLAVKIGVDQERVKVIYNAVDFAKEPIDLQQVEAIKNEYGSTSKIITTVGRLVPWKGSDGVIKILPRLIEKVGPITLLILGEGQELNKLKVLAQQLNVSSNVKFLGKIKQEDIINYLKASDLFILNTNYEGLSHTLLEAMQAGTPIVTTHVGGNPEVIDNNLNGILVNYNDIERLLTAAERILNDKQLALQLTNNAKDKLTLFNWIKTINQTAELLKSL